MTIGERIKLRRNDLGLSQDELAKLTGYSGRTAISKIELGETDIKQSRLLAFATALKTTPEKLLGVKENPIALDNLLSLGFDEEKLEKLTLSDIEEIRKCIVAILDSKM